MSIPSCQMKRYYPRPSKNVELTEIPESLPFEVNRVAQENGIFKIELSVKDGKCSLLKGFVDPKYPDELILSRVPSPVGFNEPTEITFEVDDAPKALVVKGKVILRV